MNSTAANTNAIFLAMQDYSTNFRAQQGEDPSRRGGVSTPFSIMQPGIIPERNDKIVSQHPSLALMPRSIDLFQMAYPL